MGVSIGGGQVPERLGLLEGRQVLALDVLDQSDLHRLSIVDIPLDTWELGKTRLHVSLISALSGNDLKLLPKTPDDEGLDHTLLADGGGQLGEVTHLLARLVRIGLEVLHRYHPADGSTRSVAELFDEVHVLVEVAKLQGTG